jgi:hypothetical protein
MDTNHMSGAFSIKLGQVIMSHVALFQFLRVLERELAVTAKTKEAFFADFTQVTDFLNSISFEPFLFHHLWLLTTTIYVLSPRGLQPP